MKYVIQENVFKEQHYDMLEKSIQRLGLEYDIVKIFPFTDKIVNIKDVPNGSFIVDDLPEYHSENSNIFCFGAIKLARIASQKGWCPGSMMNSNHDFEIYKNHYKDNLLNYDSIVQKFSDPIKWETNEQKFIRPTEDTKTFRGAVFYEVEWNDTVYYNSNNGHTTTLDENTPIQVSSVKRIYKEIRFWVVDGKIVTGSQYRLGNSTIYDENYEDEAVVFAQSMVDKFQLAEAFVIDVCLTNNGWKIVECGNLNCAGFYRSDLQKLIIALENYF